MALPAAGARPRNAIVAPHARCVLFDLDGTLVDTAPDLAYALNCVRRGLGLPEVPPQSLRHVASQGARGLLRVGMQLLPEHPDFARHRDAFLAHYRDNLARESRLFDGMDELLQGFEQRGLRWGIVTNKPGWLTDPLVRALQLDSRAAVVVSGDTTPNPKPAPDPLLFACRQLELGPGDCVYVGDDRRDAEAAGACGMPCIAATWGYLGEDEDPHDWGADALAGDVATLAAMLGN